MSEPTETAVALATTEVTAVSPLGLTDQAIALLGDALSEETKRAYRTDYALWVNWCELHHFAPLPADPTSITNFISELAGEGASVSRLSRVLAALRKVHAVSGESLDTTQAREAISGYRRKRKIAKAKPRRMQPLSPKDLRAMVETLDLTTLRGLRDRALLVIGFATAARRIELADLDVGDFTPCDEGLLVKVLRRKTQEDKQVALLYGQRLATCPVRAWKAFSEALADQGYSDPTLPAFPRIGRDGTIAGTAAGRGSQDGRLTGDGVAKIIRRTARRAGIKGEVGGHSLRRGFATSARAAGANHLDIARQGGWADGSRAVYGYIEEVDRFKNNPLRGIGL